MINPLGKSHRDYGHPRTDKYLGSMSPEPFERKPIITINELNRKIMISLAGFAGDGLFSDGLISNFGGDDLTLPRFSGHKKTTKVHNQRGKNGDKKVNISERTKLPCQA